MAPPLVDLINHPGLSEDVAKAPYKMTSGILRSDHVVCDNRQLDPKIQLPLRVKSRKRYVGVDTRGRPLSHARPRRFGKAIEQLDAKGCVGSSPLSFDKSASLESAKAGLVAQSAPAIQAQLAKSKIDCLI
jgi:hypothetical protein